jgi:hypothetical protein
MTEAVYAIDEFPGDDLLGVVATSCCKAAWLFFGEAENLCCEAENPPALAVGRGQSATQPDSIFHPFELGLKKLACAADSSRWKRSGSNSAASALVRFWSMRHATEVNAVVRSIFTAMERCKR